MMGKNQYKVELDGFKIKQLSVIPASLPAGIAGAPKLLLNGIPVKKIKGKYTVRDDNEKDVHFSFKTALLDPLPQLKVNNTVITIAPPLKWYAQLWAFLPLTMVFFPRIRLLGLIIGGWAVSKNYNIFRSARSSLSKFIITASIAILSFIGTVTIQFTFSSFDDFVAYDKAQHKLKASGSQNIQSQTQPNQK